MSHTEPSRSTTHTRRPGDLPATPPAPALRRRKAAARRVAASRSLILLGLLTGLAGMLAGVPAMASPQTEPATPAESAQLPAAQTLLDGYVEAVGGADALAAIDSVALTGRMEIQPMGLEGGFTMYQLRPDRSATTFVNQAIGSIRTGTGDGIAWELSDLMGPRILAGSERAFALQAASIEGFTDWRSYFDSAETLGTETVDGSQCWKLRMTTAGGSTQTWYLDTESLLLRALELKLETALGAIDTRLRLEDYREVGDALLPFRTVNVAMNQRIVTTYDSVEVNVPIDEALLEPPAEITAMLEAEADS